MYISIEGVRNLASISARPRSNRWLQVYPDPRYLSHKPLPPPRTLYRRSMLMALWWSWGGGLFLMSEVPLYGVPVERFDVATNR